MLKISSVHHTFNPGTANQVQALRGIDLHIAPHEFVTLIGSNGAGKSTLFNAISGVFPVTAGKIEIYGQDVTAWPEHRRAALVGRVFQDPLLGTAASMTIAQNLTLALLRSKPLSLRTGVTRQRRAMFFDLLAPLGLGLEDRLDARVDLLSGGQRQALTLVMACLTEPKILLLDEHTAALDPAIARKMLDITSQVIQERRLTTLMITHNMQIALDYGDRTLMMDGGQIVLDLDASHKQGLSVQDLVDLFTHVKHKRLVDDELLLA